MSPALPDPYMVDNKVPPWKRGLCPQKLLPGKGDCDPKPGTQLGIPHSPQALFWIPSTLCTKETQSQDFGGLRYSQALKSYSKMIIHKNLFVFTCSLIALQGGVKHSPGAGQLTGGNATPWLCLGQVYTCALHKAKQGLSFIIAMSRTVTGKINNALNANNNNKAGII